MSEGNGAAIAIEPGCIDIEFSIPSEDHRGKCLIDFESVDITDPEAGTLEKFTCSGNDRREHENGIIAQYGEMADGRTRLQVQAGSEALLGDQHGRGAIAYLTRIAGGDAPMNIGKAHQH